MALSIPAEIRDYLSYDPATGICTWKKKPSSKATKITVGSVAGCPNSRGYCHIQFNSTHYKAHRIAWFLHHGVDPGDKQVDHINGDRSDNRIDNLRLLTNQQNHQNRKPLGVSFNKAAGKWKSQIQVHDQKIYLGLYDCPLLAGLAYQDVKSVLHPKAER